MNKEDYPLIEFNGQKLLAVPELPHASELGVHRCLMCAAWDGDENSRPDCPDMSYQGGEQGHPCDVGGFQDDEDEHRPLIYLKPEDWQEYVVEFVRRRVSS